MDHLVDAVREGTPTAILEDPYPAFLSAADGGRTAEPKSPGGMVGMFGGRQPQPKGRTLSSSGRRSALTSSQRKSSGRTTNPIRTFRFMPTAVDLHRSSNGAQEPFEPDEQITSGLNQILLFYPGSTSPMRGLEDGTSSSWRSPAAAMPARWMRWLSAESERSRQVLHPPSAHQGFAHRGRSHVLGNDRRRARMAGLSDVPGRSGHDPVEGAAGDDDIDTTDKRIDVSPV